MKIAVVHLTDIHFRSAGNQVDKRTPHLASAIASEDPTIHTYIIVVSGDVAFSGSQEEYAIAARFFEDLKKALREAAPEAQVVVIGVPGNHDCLLPTTSLSLRNTLITGILPTLQTENPDPAILNELLAVQSNYANFHRDVFADNEWAGLCERRLIDIPGHRVQLNLYNTALLSRRDEGQGQLHVPLKVFVDKIELDKKAALSISVFHHSYLWLESNVSISFRSHIERTSDVALMGHQHFQHSFYKKNSRGERVFYIEGGALQQEDYPIHSEFQLLLFELDSPALKSLHFRWADDLYRRTETPDWNPFELNRGIRADYRITEEFSRELNELGTPLSHRLKGDLGLRDIFLYPDFVVRTQVPKPSIREVHGRNLIQYIEETDRIVFQFPALGGKTSLSRILFSDLLNDLEIVPILLDGKEIDSAQDTKVSKSFWRKFEHQYGGRMLEPFRQLIRAKRALIIDDWHAASLGPEGRRTFLQIASQYFGKVILFTDDLFQLQELVSNSPDTLLSFDNATPMEFGNRLRGQLIDRWVTFGREHLIGESELAREIEDTEDLVRNLIGKNTLPSLPFIVLCILQADQEDKVDSPEAGSFGYLYEVLVTTTLNKSFNRKTQLEKKYMFLSMLAYEMFTKGTDMVGIKRAREIAAEYSHTHLVKVDVEALLTDLEEARVLIKFDGNYRFGYSHLFFYFVARYYRENLSGEQAHRLQDEIHHMADHISYDRHSTILMFLLYLTRDSTDLIERLTTNADRIYQGEAPANMDMDVAFLNQFCDEDAIRIPDDVDLTENRRKRREAADRVEKNVESLINQGTRDFVYSDDLSDADKFHLAYKHIELLGQVLRNFPGSLPRDRKLSILRSTYLLGLRLLGTIFRFFESSYPMYADVIRKALEESEGEEVSKDIDKIRVLVDRLVVLLNKLVVLGILMKISSDVGLADLEMAYTQVLGSLDSTNATRLLYLTIKLEHFDGFPESDVRELHQALSKNAFADNILKDLVMIHIQKFNINRTLRQKMTTLFGTKSNLPSLMDPSRKK